MRLALIPPISLLHYNTRYQLALPQLLNDQKYFVYYNAEAKKGSYLILDNGAAEGFQIDNTQLLAAAKHIGAHEVVIPDVMGKKDGTIEAALRFFKNPYAQENNYKYMYVAHGSSVEDIIKGIEDVVVRFKLPISTVGIPRHHMQSLGNPFIRLVVADKLHKSLPGLQIHLLGASPLWSSELKEAARLPYVRGMDTSMPFVYAWHGKRVGTDHGKLDRPDNYFNLPSSEFFHDLVKDNVATMLKWVSAAND